MTGLTTLLSQHLCLLNKVVYDAQRFLKKAHHFMDFSYLVPAVFLLLLYLWDQIAEAVLF